MATQTVINSNATRGISILIDQPQQQVEIVGSQQQQQQQQQQRHATAKINISPVATLTTKTLITTTTTTTPYAPASTTSSAYSSLGSDEQLLPQASQSSSTSMTTVNGNQQHHNNNKNYSTTFIDINCQDAADDDGADQILRTGSESQKSTATFQHSLLRVAAAATTAATSQVSSQEQVNKCEAITTTTVTTTTTATPSGERRKTQTAAASESTAAAAAAVKAENGERVGQLGQSVGISITHERDNNKSSSGIQLHHKANDDDDDVVSTRPTTRTTTTTIIACNSSSSTQTNISHNDDDDDHDDHDRRHHDDDDVAEDEHGYKTKHHDVVAVAHDAIVESRLRRSHRDRCLSSDVAQVVVSAAATTATGAAATTGTSSLPTSQRPEQLENFVTQTLNHRLELADCASALTESVDSNAVKDSHVVKIKISPTNNGAAKPSETHHHQHSHEQPPKVDEQKRFSVFSDKLNSIGENNHFAKVSRVHLQNDNVIKNGAETEPQHETRIENIKLKINDKMVQKPSGTVTATTTPSPTAQVTTNSGNTTVTELNVSNPSAYLYYMMSSGQFSPCDTLDSGTGSDLESNGNGNGNGHRKISANNNNNNNSGNSSHKMSSNGAPNKLELHLKTTKIRMHAVGVGGAGGDKQHHSAITSNGDHQRAGSLTDSEESESSLSCDSINSSDYLRHSSNSPTNGHHHHSVVVPKAPPTPTSLTPPGKSSLATFLPDSLLRDIRDRKFPTNDFIAKYVDNNHDDDRRALYDAIEESVVADTHNGNASLDYQVVESHVKYARSNSGNMTTMTTNQRMSLPNKTFVLNTADGTFVDTKMNSMPRTYEADKYYDFHVNEHDNFRSFGGGGGGGSGSGCGDGSELGDTCSEAGSWIDYEPRALHEDAFAGYKDIRCVSAASTIRSSKGTVRGVRNRVRNGIATFLQLQQPNIKNFKEKDHGKVVLYTTSMGIIRDTYAKCSNMKQILRTLLVKFEERDVFMSVEYQQEIKARMHSEVIKVPQLFVEGQHIGDAETVERLNESGELRQLLKPYKSIATTYTCQTCGGYRLLPCPSCNGSKKSVHRNHFTAEFVALKCMNCDEVGLVKCHNC